MDKRPNKQCRTERIGYKHFSFLFIFMAFTMIGCENTDTYEMQPENQGQDLIALLTRGSMETDVFITEWTVPKDSIVKLPLDTTYKYEFVVDWGDDSKLQVIDNQNYYFANHRYTKNGIYRIRILGICETWNWFLNNNTSNQYLTKVIQWGNVGFKSMVYSFYNCTALTSIPAGIPNVESYYCTFHGCTNLSSLPEGLFAGCDRAKVFESTFYRCKNLKTLPADLFKDCLSAVSFRFTFSFSGLQFLPNGLFKNCRNIEGFMRTFGYCADLISIPGDMFVGCENVISFTWTFQNCPKLTAIPIELFDDCKKVTVFTGTFRLCTSLTGPTPNTNGIELWERQGCIGYPAKIDGDRCFYGCTGLTEFETKIPKEWK